MDRKRRGLFRLFSLVVILCTLFSNAGVGRGIAAPTAAAEDLSIRGQVVDQQQRPLAGVTLTDDQGHTTLTQSDGRYELNGLQPGKYVVTPSLENRTLLPYYRVVDLETTSAEDVNFHEGAPIDRSRSPLPAPPVQHPNSAQQAPADPAHLPVPVPAPAAPAASASGISAQAALSPGQPGLTFRWLKTLGVTQVPYVADTGHINAPGGVFIDGSDRLLVVETAGSRLLRYTAEGTSDLEPIGKAGVMYTDNYVFSSPSDAAVDGQDNIWVADNTRLAVYTGAGEHLFDFPDSEPWRSGTENDRFNYIDSLAFNSDHTQLYVSDSGNQRVQVFNIVDGKPVFSNVTLGTTGVTGSDGTHFNNPTGLTYFNGSVYVADFYNHRIQKCDPAGGACSTFMGVSGEAGWDLGHLNMPTGIKFSNGSAYVTDAGNLRVLRCAMDGNQQIITCAHFAGTAGERGTDPNHFSWPDALALDSAGKVYVSDMYNHRVLIFDTDGNPAGQRGSITGAPYLVDTPQAVPQHFNTPEGMVIDPADGSLYFTENRGMRLVKLDSDGVLQWTAGEAGIYGSDTTHLGGYSNGPEGNLALDQHGLIYVSDSANNRVKIYLKDGTVFGQMGGYGQGNNQFYCPGGVAISPANGDIYVADRCNQRVQVFDANRNYKATLGQTGVTGSDAAHFNFPWGIAVDASNNVYVVEYGNQRVQKCRVSGSGGTCQPFAGVAGATGNDFNRLNYPVAVALGPDGLVYITDNAMNRVQVFDPSGAYRATLGGEWGWAGDRLMNPTGLAVDADNNVYIADRDNHRIQVYARGVPGWTQKSLNGFGTAQTPTYALAELNDQLYTGAMNLNGSGAQIWRMGPDGAWQEALRNGPNIPLGQFVRDLFRFNNVLYAGLGNDSADAPSHAQILRSSADGSTWTNVTPPAMGNDPVDAQVEYFSTFGGQLYASTWSASTVHGAEIWRMGLDDAGTWTRVVANGFGNANNVAILNLIAFKNAFYALTYNSTTGPEIWTSPSGDLDSWTQVMQGSFEVDSHNTSLLMLVQFGDYLYAATSNCDLGGEIWRTFDGQSWEKAASGGFGNVNNCSIRSMAVYNNQLYAFTYNHPSNGNGTGMEIWSSANGLDWERSAVPGGLGNSANRTALYGHSALTYNGRMFLSVQNSTTGGSIWAMNIGGWAVSGTVTLPDGITGVAGVTLSLSQAGKEVAPPATTDEDGRYSFIGVQPGTNYRLVPSRGGYTFTPAERANFEVKDADRVWDFTATASEVSLLAPANLAKLEATVPVTFDWADLGGATKYALQISKNSNFIPLLKTVTVVPSTYLLTAGLTANTTYYWQVRAYKGTVAGPWSGAWTFTTPNPPAAPVLLAPLSAAKLDSYTPTFTWKASLPAPHHYRLQVSQSATFATLDVDENTLNATPSYAFPGGAAGLAPNRVFYWRVRAVSASGDASLWSLVRTLTTLPAAPGLAYPGNLSPLFTLRPELGWQPVDNTTGYQVQIARNTAFTLLFQSVVVKTTSYTLTTSLTANTNYWWRVRANGKGGPGKWSEVRQFQAPQPPALPVLTSPIVNALGMNRQPAFAWNPVANATSYRIQVTYRAGFPQDGSTFVDEPTTTPGYQLPDGALFWNSVYYWRVSACNSANQCSLWVERKFTTQPPVPTLVIPDEGMQALELKNEFAWINEDTAFTANPPTYELRVARDVNFRLIVLSYKTTIPSNEVVTWLTLPAGSTLYWHVRSKGLSGYSAWSEMRSLSTPIPPAPPVLSLPANGAVALSYDEVLFKWTAPKGDIQSYHFQASLYTDFSYLADDQFLTLDQFDNPAAPSYISYLDPGTFYWRVQAINADGAMSSWSAVRKLSTLARLDGYVADAVTGDGIMNAEVRLNGGDPQLTDEYGYFEFNNVKPGAAKITISPDQYAPRTIPLTVIAARYNHAGYSEMALLPSDPLDNDYRIVLYWADVSPYRKLDANLWLPKENPNHLSGANPGSLNNFPYAEIRPAGTSASILTLTGDSLEAGTYSYAVNQLSIDPVGKPLAGAAAEVLVYHGSSLLKRITPPAAGAGAWWHVFDLNGATGAVTQRNLMRTTPLAPYTDQAILGRVMQSNGHPLGGVSVDYGIGSTLSRPDGTFSITGIGPDEREISLTRQDYTFDPPSITASTGDTGINFTATRSPTATEAGAPTQVAVQGEYAYVGAGPRLDIVRVTDKTDLQHPVSTFWIAEGEIRDIELAGRYAYVAMTDYGSMTGAGLNIIDISDPAAPKLAAFWNVNDCQGVAVSGNYAYVISGSESTFITLDVSDPTAPKYVSRVSVYSHPTQLAVSGKYAYVVSANVDEFFDSYSTLQGIDLTNPARPVRMLNYTYLPYEWVNDIQIVGNTAYLAGAYSYSYVFSGRLRLMDISNPKNLTQMSLVDLNWEALRVAVKDNRAYVADGYDGLQVIDVGEAYNPRLKGGFSVSDAAMGVSLLDQYAYVVDGAQLQVVDVRDPANMPGLGIYIPDLR